MRPCTDGRSPEHLASPQSARKDTEHLHVRLSSRACFTCLSLSCLAFPCLVQGVAAPPVLYPERELPALIDDSDSDLYDPRLGYQSDTDFENEADERRRVPLLARGARPFSWSSWGHVSSTDVGTESAEDLSRHVCHHLDDVAWMIVTFLRADYEEDFGYDWAILSAVRNKLVHIQNGNGSRGSLEAPTRCSPRLAARRRAQDAFLFRPFACSLQGFAFPCLSLRFLVLHLAQACICTELRRLSASPSGRLRTRRRLGHPRSW